MYRYNDNELLYLIGENNDDAKDILISKYKPLVLKYIKKNLIKQEEFDDYYQEGMLCLIKAINTYNEMYSYSFNSYFELILKRKFIDLIKKKKSQESISYSDELEEYVVDYLSIINDDRNNFIEENNVKLSKFELLVYQYKCIECLKPAKIAKILEKDIKQIYDAINRIKIKTAKNNKKI